jgi:subtilisin family serine protease
MERMGRLKLSGSSWVCSLIVILGTAFFSPSPRSVAGIAAVDDPCPGELNVCVKSGKDINRINARYGTIVKGHIAGTRDYLLGLPPGADEEDCLRRMEKDGDLEFADRNYNFRLPETRQVSQAFIDQVSQAFIDGQSPPRFYGQSSLRKLNLADAHQFSRGTGVRVAVLDTGLDFSHPLFAGRIAGPVYDFVDNDLSPDDEPNGSGFGHGTFVAGLVVLAAPDVTILPLRVFDRDGRGTSYNIARAIRFATDHGARVINMSFGLVKNDKLIQGAMNRAYGRAHFVASAGNEDRDSVQFPAQVTTRTISVTATTENDLKAPFANFNKNVDVSSPGVQLYSAYPGHRWAWWSGTSFSTALVSGEAALLFALKPRLTNSDAKNIIKDSGVRIDSVNVQAHRNKLGRRVDFRAAIGRLMSYGGDDDDDDDDGDDDDN